MRWRRATTSCDADGSPLFWIGVGVGLSALFSWVATNLKVSVIKSIWNYTAAIKAFRDSIVISNQSILV
ncbi:hypothetical protein CsSME_00006614 [Camellia sinensis var. sinensis]